MSILGKFIRLSSSLLIALMLSISSSALSFANEPSGPGTAGSVGQATWRVEADKLLIQVSSGLNQSLRVDTPAGSNKRVLTSDDETMTVTAYSGSSNQIYLNGKLVAVAFVAASEGVKFGSIKPVFSAIWTANTINLSVRNLQGEGTSLLRLQVGSKLEEQTVTSSEFMKSYELSAFEPIKIWISGHIAFRQSATDKYKNCKQLNAVFVGGISKALRSPSESASLKAQPTISKSLYSANKSLDRDKDGIACEK